MIRPLTLRTRFFFAFLGLSLLVLVSSALLAVATTAGALREKIGTFSLQLVDQIALNLDGEFRKVKGLTDELLFSPEISSRMVGYRSARESDRAISRYIFGKVLQAKFLNLDRIDDAVMLLSPVAIEFPSDVIHLNRQLGWSVAELDQMARTVPLSGEAKNLGLSLVALPGEERDDIVLVRLIRNSLANETLGFLMIIIDPEFFSRIYRSVDVGAGADLFVVDGSGKVVSSRNPERSVGALAIPTEWLPADKTASSLLKNWEGQEHLISLAPLGTTGWTVVGAVPSSYLDSETGKIATQVFLMSLLALLLALLISLRIAEGFSAPLRNLEKTMGLFGEGVIQARSAVGRDDEIGRLQRSFNAMADDITNLLARIDEEHRRLQLSELRVLEYQINPHFLYNTLDSINWMALGAGQKEISGVVTALAKFFRLSLSRGQEVYRVRDEVEHVAAYLSISQMRYPDCFRWEFDVEDDILDRSTLKIVLQPLVENAIKHGFDKKLQTGLIRIEGRAVEGGLEWKVSDNGRGIPAEKLQALGHRLASLEVREPGPDGFGLVNVHHRIRLNYGPLFGLVVESTPGQGTCVVVRLPWEDENSNE